MDRQNNEYDSGSQPLPNGSDNMRPELAIYPGAPQVNGSAPGSHSAGTPTVASAGRQVPYDVGHRYGQLNSNPSNSPVPSAHHLTPNPSVGGVPSPAAGSNPYYGAQYSQAAPQANYTTGAGGAYHNDMGYSNGSQLYRTQAGWNYPVDHHSPMGVGNTGVPRSTRPAPPSNGQVMEVPHYSFVPLPGQVQHKRPRRRYEEIERMYQCGWQGCEKAYGTLNHLNAHVTMQNHGEKRHPEEFKEIRKEWKLKKKAQEAAREEAAERQSRATSSQSPTTTQQMPLPAAPTSVATPNAYAVSTYPTVTYGGATSYSAASAGSYGANCNSPTATSYPSAGYSSYPPPPSGAMPEYTSTYQHSAGYNSFPYQTEGSDNNAPAGNGTGSSGQSHHY